MKTVGLGLTFQDRWEVACSNACISRLLFTIIIFFKVKSTYMKNLTRNILLLNDKEISAWSRWKYQGIPARFFTRTFTYIVVPVTWISTIPNWFLADLHNVSDASRWSQSQQLSRLCKKTSRVDSAIFKWLSHDWVVTDQPNFEILE